MPQWINTPELNLWKEYTPLNFLRRIYTTDLNSIHPEWTYSPEQTLHGMKRMDRKNVYCKHGSSHSFLPRRSVDQSRLVIGIADLTHFVQHHFLVGRKMWRGWQAVYSLWTSVGISSRNCCRGRCGFRSEGINRSEHLNPFLEFTAGASML